MLPLKSLHKSPKKLPKKSDTSPLRGSLRDIIEPGRNTGLAIAALSQKNEDFISLTDIGRAKNPERSDELVRNWLRNRNTIEFLGIWERLNNPGFYSVEFDRIKIIAGLNSFTINPKQWIDRTGAIGIVPHTGRYGETYASEADVLKVALFGQTAKEWREKNPDEPTPFK